MIVVPHTLRFPDERILLWAINLAVLLQAATVLTVLLQHWRGWRVVRVALVIVFIGWLAEWIGSSTGVPFGAYRYTERLQPQFMHVPLLVPLAWFMMLPPAWAVAETLSTSRHRLTMALVSGIAIMAWDLLLDPQMVGWDLWRWEQTGQYFGIPLVNFAGWIVIGSLITLAARPQHVPCAPLLLIYASAWLLESIGLAFFMGQPGAASVGFVGMGALTVTAVRRQLSTARTQADRT